MILVIGYYLNNHKIAEYSPFNVAHVIKSGTLLIGYDYFNKEKLRTITSWIFSII